MGAFGESFRGTYRTLANAQDRRYHNTVTRPQQERERAEDRAWQKERQGMVRENHQMSLEKRQREYEAFRREEMREASEQNMADAAMRLGLERAFMEGELAGLDHNQMAGQMPDAYFQVFNRLEADRVDPTGDGRQVTGIIPLPGGKFGFTVEGGGVEGRKPITQGRGTEADGDNIVDTMSMDELVDEHMGMMQAFRKKFPEQAAAIDDPEERKAMIDYILNLQAAAGDKDAIAEKKARRTEAQAATKATTANALENTKQSNRVALEGKKQENRVALRNTPQAKEPTPPKSLSEDDKINRLNKMASMVKKEFIDQGLLDDEMPSDQEIIQMARDRLDMLRAAVNGTEPQQAAPEPVLQGDARAAKLAEYGL